MTSAAEIVDLVIIGGGPAGLFASFYAGLRRMTVKIVDSLDVLGGQLITLYPEKYIYDVAGFPKVLAKDLVQNLIEQGTQHAPDVCLGEQVQDLILDEATRVYTIRTSKAAHRARSILIAAGVGSFKPKTLPIARAYEGRGVYYFAPHLEEFRGKRLLIVGGGDSAVDWANTLAAVTGHQILIHRRDQFRAHEGAVKRMLSGPTEVRRFHELRAIGGAGRVESAVIFDNRTNNETALRVDAVLLNLGFDSSLGPLKDWGLELEGGSIKVDGMMQTNRPGIFAAGDIATFPGKLKLIATGFGEACVAVNYAKHYLDPGANIFPGHSSNMKK
jgi:thioredoxin reductase (NADPH)